MGKISEAVGRFVRTTGLDWQTREDGSAMRTFVTGDNGVWSLVVDWNEEETFFACYSICSVHAPAEVRPAVAEYLTRANWRMCLCNFEMDYEDGEIRLRMGIPLRKGSLSQAMIKDIVYSSNSNMDHYLFGLMKVVFGGATAEEAFRQAMAADKEARQSDPTARQADEPAVPPITRQQRVEQVADLLRLMNKRAHEEVEGACFLILKARADHQTKPLGPDRFVQFCFECEWFSIDVPSTALAKGEDLRLLEATKRLYRESDSLDSKISEPKDLTAYTPICRKYIYGDELEAAEDACFVLYDFMKLDPGAELYVQAASFEGVYEWGQDEPLGKSQEERPVEDTPPDTTAPVTPRAKHRTAKKKGK